MVVTAYVLRQTLIPIALSELHGDVPEHLLDALSRLARGLVDAGDEVVTLLAKGLHVRVAHEDARFHVELVPTEKYFCVFGVGDDVKEMLREDVEGVWVVEGKDEDGCLAVLVVAARDARHALHAASVPELQLDRLRAVAYLVDLAEVVQADGGGAIGRRRERIRGKPTEERSLAHPVLAHQNDLGGEGNNFQHCTSTELP